MTEAGISPVAKIYGCDRPGGWVPYPPHQARRHPLTDAVGIIDDPCDRPAYLPPNYSPTPKFKPPKEGYPNNICNLEDYAAEKDDEDSDEPGATVNITVGHGTPHEITLCPEPVLQTPTVYANPPTIEDCCADGRCLDTLEREVSRVIGPHKEMEMGMKNWAQCQSVCQPLLESYPCRGVIRSPRPDWTKLTAQQKCRPTMVSANTPSPDELKPLTGREFVEGKKTCDMYPVHPKLPERFNNPEWFKGYGCEKQAHPFYMTTSQSYGRFPPNAHTMTQSYYPRESQFTEKLAKAGMPRNRSLNLYDVTFL